jgi:putative transcriptional regulator
MSTARQIKATSKKHNGVLAGVTAGTTERAEQHAEDTEFGDKMVQGFREMAAYMAGDTEGAETEEYEPKGAHPLTPGYIQVIRRKVARSTKKFEALFGISARTMEVYERGQRKPDAATVFLLRTIEDSPEVALRIVSRL